MRANKKTMAAGVAAAGLLGVGLYAAVPALAATPSPSTHPSADGKGHHFKDGHKRHGRFAGVRGVHGEATVKAKDNTFKLVDWQRGQVTGKTGTTLTVKSADGAVWTWTVDAKTRVRKDRAKSAFGNVANGDQVAVFGTRAGDTRTAVAIREPQKKAN
ncbi:DUF5666 domain-containing protein [Actinomadura rupiterrae]|uniref:DUF5666 domain-containing protein n=1 Tax=Actinomadura rupiterrae TaxID=559627 RepID=UPI0020A29D33|nr:DUF5666 domain-containing protein [Actinomadura rupiterrae]MCP2337856.1 hypothetical protein [Actinomadura rupiterrae]